MDRKQIEEAVDEVAEAFFNPRKWAEIDHPRDDAGKFAPAGVSTGTLARVRDTARLSKARNDAKIALRKKSDEKKRKAHRIKYLVRTQFESMAIGEDNRTKG